MSKINNNFYSPFTRQADSFVAEKNLHHKTLAILENVMIDLKSIVARLERFEASKKVIKGRQSEFIIYYLGDRRLIN